MFLDGADPTHTWGGLALVDMGAEGAQSAAATPAASKKSFTAKGAKGTSTGSAEDAASEMPDSVLWVCKDCLMGGKCCNSGGKAAATAGPGKAVSAAGRGRVPSGAGGTAGAEELSRLREGIKNRDIAVRLLVRELKQAGLPLPALPPGVPINQRVTNGGDWQLSGSGEAGGAGGRLLGRITGSFGRSSEPGGGMNDTAKIGAASGSSTAAGGGITAAAGKVERMGAGSKGSGVSGSSGGGGCFGLGRKTAAVHPER